MNAYTARTHTMALLLTITMFFAAVGGTLVGLAGPAGAAALAPSGSYTAGGPAYGSAPITFYVSANGTQLQDVADAQFLLTCSPGGEQPREPFAIPAIAIKSNRSFNATTTQHGVYGGFAATFTYTLQGNFHSVSQNGATAAGMIRETMIYTDSNQHKKYTCTTNNLSWNATRDDGQPTQRSSAPPVGSYQAGGPAYGSAPITFYVSANGTQLQDVADAQFLLTCSPGGEQPREPFAIPAIAIKSNRSFNATTTQHGVYGGFAATFTYTFQGNFHSLGSDNMERASGMIRETMVYTDSNQHKKFSCTTNNLSWTGELQSS